MKKVEGQPEPAVGQRWRAEFRDTVRELIRFEHDDDGTKWAILYAALPRADHRLVRIEAWKLGTWPWQWRIYTPESEQRLQALRERRRQLAVERRRKAAEAAGEIASTSRAHIGSWWQSHGQAAQIIALFRDDKGTLRAVMDWGDDVPQTYPEVAALTVDHGWTETEPQPFELAGPRYGL